MILNEIKALECISEHAALEVVPTYARTADNIFDISGPQGQHKCIAMQPQGCPLLTLQRMYPGHQIPKELVVAYIQRMIACVHWLHSVCDIMHAGKWPASQRSKDRRLISRQTSNAIMSWLGLPAMLLSSNLRLTSNRTQTSQSSRTDTQFT